jgi:hypothetical protein
MDWTCDPQSYSVRRISETNWVEDSWQNSCSAMDDLVDTIRDLKFRDHRMKLNLTAHLVLLELPFAPLATIVVEGGELRVLFEDHYHSVQ